MTKTGKPILVYADASVYGGAFDEEFEVASQVFFDNVRSGQLHLIVSMVVRDELENAPEKVLPCSRRCVGMRKPWTLQKKPFSFSRHI